MGVEFPCGTANRYEHVAALRNVATVLALPVSVTARGTRVLVMRTTPAPASQFPDPKVALEEHITFVQGTPIEDGDLLPSVAEADHKGGQTDGQN
jgi:alpha-D-ribose 1-methylphosphonate 5-phosphate C-P lyase